MRARNFAGFAVVIVLVLIAAGLSALASADSSTESTPETRTITLQPGDNFVGWVGEPIPIEDLFEAVPEIEAVSSWDALGQRTLSTSQDEDGSIWETVRTIEPGAAYVMRLGGDSAVNWTRSIIPARAQIKLRTGENWVAWLGPDDWQIEDVAKGIGVSLLEIRLGEHVYDPASSETADDWPAVMRGDALVVAVTQDVIWLQPTFVMPQIHYAGNVDHGKRRMIERDLTATLDYSARELSVQADPFSLVVVVAASAKAAHDKTTELGREWDWEAFRNYWQRVGGWYSSTQDAFYLKSSSWEGHRSGRYFWGRYVVLHEYIHALQYQLMGASYANLNWLLEGSAEWFESDLSTQDRNGYPLSRTLINALNQASQGPPLEEIESGNKTWQYSFGLVAADLLVERAGKGSVLDFYRALAPDRAGLAGDWETRPTMRSAFVAAFGLTLEEFYDEFETLMAKRRGSAKRRPASNEFALDGTIVNSDGTPRVGASLVAREYKDGYPAGWNRRAKSTEDGTFELFVRRRADYRIWIELGDDYRNCQYWWSEDSNEARPSGDEASLIEVGSSQPEPIAITVDADQCRWRIAGVLSGPDDQPLAGIEVRAQRESSSTSVRTEHDGSFTFVLTEPGSYQLSVDLGGCWLYWRADDPPGMSHEAVEIEVLDQDITDIEFQVLEDPCRRVSGRLLDPNGAGIEDVNVYAHLDDRRVSRRTDSSGSFTLVLAETGDYYLYAFPDGCRVYYRPDGATGLRSERSLIPVSERDVSDVVFRLRDNMCVLRISGRLLNPDGSPGSGLWINGASNSGGGGDRPADDGTFYFAVPAAGSYKLSVTIDGCRVFYAGRGLAGDESQSHSLKLSRTDVTGIEFRLPENPAAFCG